MEFKIVNIDSEYESESDYDTAVDLVTYHYSRENLTLETLAGVKIFLQRSQTSKGNRYISPCEEEDPSYSEDLGEETDLHVWAEVLLPLPTLEEADQAFLSALRADISLLKEQEKEYWFEDASFPTVDRYPELKSSVLYKNMTPEAQNNLFNYMDYLSLADNVSQFDSNRTEVALSEEQANKILNLAFGQSKVKKGWTLRIDLGEDSEKQIGNLDKLNYHTMAQNMKTRIHNNCSLSSHILNEQIEKLFAQAKLEMKALFHPTISNEQVSKHKP